MDINIIGVPIYYGCDRKGVENGPNKLREKGLISIISQNCLNKVFDFGNLNVEIVSEDKKYENHNKMKYLSPITELNKNLAHIVYSSLKGGSFPFVVGGDHSLGLGSLAGASKYFKDDLAVIWVDAHGDINTFDSSPSGNVHGMPLAASMGFGYKDLTNLYFHGRKIDPKKVFIICARDLDEGEQSLIKNEGLNVWSTNYIQNIGVEALMDEVYKKLDEIKVNNIHLSFDIDCLDSSLVPGTGTPVDSGMNFNEVKKILEKILETKKVRSMDFVEFNPEIDKDNITLNNCLDMLKVIGNNL